MQNNFVNRQEQGLEYAGFWVRLAAYCIDSVIVWIGLLFVKLVLGIFSSGGSGILQAHLLFRYSLRDMILYVFQVLYFILLTYGTGRTLGKRLLNIRVVNADLSPDLTLMNVVYRETVGRFLCGLSIGIGYIMAGVDREKKGLHDMICDTRVIYAKKIKVLPKYQPPQYYPPISGNGSGPVPMPPYGNPPRKDPPPVPPYNGPIQDRPPVPPYNGPIQDRPQVPPYNGPIQDRPPVPPYNGSVQDGPPMSPYNVAVRERSLEPLYQGPLDKKPPVSGTSYDRPYQERSSEQNSGAGREVPQEEGFGQNSFAENEASQNRQLDAAGQKPDSLDGSGQKPL